jgi:hypothetical protein
LDDLLKKEAKYPHGDRGKKRKGEEKGHPPPPPQKKKNKTKQKWKNERRLGWKL